MSAFVALLVIGPLSYAFVYLLYNAQGWTSLILPTLLGITFAAVVFGRLNEAGLNRLPLRHQLLPVAVSLIAVYVMTAFGYWAQSIATTRT